MQKISVQLGLVGSCSLNDDYYGDVASHGDRSVGGLQLLLFLQFFLLYNPKIFFFGLHLATLTAIVLSLLLPVCPSTTGSVLVLISDSLFFSFSVCFVLLSITQPANSNNSGRLFTRPRHSHCLHCLSFLFFQLQLNSCNFVYCCFSFNAYLLHLN